MTPEIALAELTARAVPDKAAGMAAHHGAGRVYLGIPAHEIDALAGAWRAASPPEARLELAAALWQSDIHEARIAAAKLLAQARIRPDDSGAWRLIVSWVPGFDTLAITEQAAIAGQKRLVADPSRLDEVEGWTRADQVWTRHAALLMTLP
ncbi:DNA alkylation repair protein, partial [Rhodovulum sp.]|uniref:DNA alkylation repair protein n=1 Tax=Rhodovulum sp. TaxID=34009 RepID=UPI0017DB03D3